MIPSLVVSSSLYLSTSICVDFTLKKYNLKYHYPLSPNPYLPLPPMENPPSSTSLKTPSSKETKKIFAKFYCGCLYCIVYCFPEAITITGSFLHVFIYGNLTRFRSFGTITVLKLGNVEFQIIHMTG